LLLLLRKLIQLVLLEQRLIGRSDRLIQARHHVWIVETELLSTWPMWQTWDQREVTDPAANPCCEIAETGQLVAGCCARVLIGCEDHRG
jgi:hypothetical protein